jgi:hypothetical protein
MINYHLSQKLKQIENIEFNHLIIILTATFTEILITYMQMKFLSLRMYMSMNIHTSTDMTQMQYKTGN